MAPHVLSPTRTPSVPTMQQATSSGSAPQTRSQPSPVINAQRTTRRRFHSGPPPLAGMVTIPLEFSVHAQAIHGLSCPILLKVDSRSVRRQMVSSGPVLPQRLPTLLPRSFGLSSAPSLPVCASATPPSCCLPNTGQLLPAISPFARTTNLAEDRSTSTSAHLFSSPWLSWCHFRSLPCSFPCFR